MVSWKATCKVVLKDFLKANYDKETKDRIFITDIRTVRELLFQEVAEQKSDVFHNFKAERDSGKMLSVSCPSSAVQIVIRILQVPLNSPTWVSKAN